MVISRSNKSPLNFFYTGLEVLAAIFAGGVFTLTGYYMCYTFIG